MTENKGQRPEKVEKRIRCGPVLFTMLVRLDNCYSGFGLLKRVRSGEEFGIRDLYEWFAWHGVPFKMEFRPREYEGVTELVSDFATYLSLARDKGRTLKKDAQGFFSPVSGTETGT